MNRLHRSLAVRLAALFFALFTCAVGVVFVASYFVVRAQSVERTRKVLVARADAISRSLAEGPSNVMLAAGTAGQVAALFDASGSLLAGRADVPMILGWREVPGILVHLNEVGDENSETALLYGRRVGDRVLVLGEGLHVAEDAGEALLTGLLSSLVFVGLVGFAGAAFITWRVDRRLRRTEEALAAYGSGKTSVRLPVTGINDELDRMALAVNGLLDRVAALIETIRQITVDAAHDLKTPLTRLRYRLAEAEESRNPADVKAIVRSAAADAEQIVATFDALLRIAQIEAGASRTRFATLDLSDVLETVADAYGPDVEQTGHHLETRIASSLYVNGDRELLIQAFANLVENAIRHAGPNATITIEAVRGPSVQASVSDNGPGVPEADRQRVLLRFVRLDASRSTSGTGLGLSLVKAIADLHGASLVLSDDRPGLRATMTFRYLVRTPGNGSKANDTAPYQI
jgi:signal transduction histidine kinase